MGEAYPLALDINILCDVDRELYGKENVISSDSVVLDHSISWVNLARHCLELRGGQAIACY